jgi:hypothetical protein
MRLQAERPKTVDLRGTTSMAGPTVKKRVGVNMSSESKHICGTLNPGMPK